MDLKNRAQAVHEKLLKAFGQPEWRNPLQPLDELISTILSQNTNDNNRGRAFQALRQRFPTWEAVRDADEQAVIDARSARQGWETIKAHAFRTCCEKSPASEVS